MPTLTPAYMLPTIAPSDPMCDAPDTLCALRDRLNVLIDAYDVTVATSVAAVPAGQINRAYLTTYPVVAPPAGIAPIPFLDVGIDTDGMVDLNRDSRVIQVQREGLYQVVGYVVVGLKSDASALDETFLSLRGGIFLGNEMDSTTEIRATGAVTMITVTDLRGAVAGTEFALQIVPRFTAGTLPFPIRGASLTAFWVSDRT